MTLVQLRHLVVLAELGAFVAASKALFLTQPALTRSIQALEDELGGRLFDRVGRRIALTAFGQQVLGRARRLVADADALKLTGKGMHAGLMGSLRMGLSSAPGALLATPLMLHMAEHHPSLKVHIARGHTELLVHELRAQHLDAAIVDVRSLRPAADIEVAQVFELAAGFFVRPGHPLLQRSEPVLFADLLAYPLASTPLSDEVARLLIGRYGPQANPDDLVTLRSDETMNLVEVARHSNAIVLTVNAVVQGLVRLPISPALDATARFGLVTLAHRQEAPALGILRAQLPVWVERFSGVPLAKTKKGAEPAPLLSFNGYPELRPAR